MTQVTAEAATEAAPLRGGELGRFLWTQLTSMRTALVLLFALALAAIPGSLLPQRPVSPIRVKDWITDNPLVGPAFDAVGLFDVYASPWFAAIYLLLFISLIGCIIPRIGVYVRALNAPPPLTPKRLQRMPDYRTASTAEPAQSVLQAAEQQLRSCGFRVRRLEDSVSAERGYTRELGNLVFHVSLVVMLIGLAWASLLGYKGNTIVVEGQAFSNTLTQYDDLTTGAAFAPEQLDRFTIWVDQFDVKFETGPVQRGAARLFLAKVRVAEAGETRPGVIEVNNPLIFGSSTVHLVGHGYAPVVTVRDGAGDVAFSGPVPFLPQDGNFTSLGVIKAPDARPSRLAFEGSFLPATVTDELGTRSVFPDAVNPELFLTAWTGPPREETGAPENVYSLDKAGLVQLTEGEKKVAFRLKPGESFDLPGGGSISFDSWKRWTKLQVGHTPGLWLVLVSVLVAVTGLCLSLFIRPRRIWLRVVGDRVEVAGLERAEGRGGMDDELNELIEAATAGKGTT
ncbi:MAG: cytochrome c biogenesis protein ResB [Micropruina sp.]|nr:cytochrome c biogenesis protein ResB [Micropruina sp.]